MMIASPIWGSLADRYGRKPMVVRAMLGGGLTILLMGFVRTAEQLIFLRALQGLLSGVISATSALIVSKVPRDKVGYSMGILQLGLWSGVSIGPLIGGVLSDYFGFRVTFIITALLLGGAGIAVLLGVDESHTPPIAASKGLRAFAGNWKRILSFPGLFATMIVRFLSSVGRTALAPILPLFMQSLMPGAAHIAGYTGVILGISSAATTGCAVYLGRLGDRVGHQRVAFVSAVVTGAGFFPQMFVTSPWQLTILYTLSGAGIGGLTPSLSALLARYSKPADAGSVYGLDNSITAAGRSISPLIAALVASGFGLRAVFSVTGMIFFGTAVLLAVLLRKETIAGGSQSEETIEAELEETPDE
jgi:DHA1 family multidrug resistance protein-like MFS transporter